MKNNIRKLYIFNFFVSMQLFAGIILPFFTLWGGLNLTQVLILQAWYSLCIVLLELPSGAFADIFGRRTSLSLAAIVNAVGAVVYASTPNFYVFVIGEFLWAVAASLISGSENAMVYDTLKKIKGTKESKAVFSKYESAGLLGMMVGAPIGSILASNVGLQAPMFYFFIPLSVAFLVTLTLKEPSFSSKSKEKNYIETIKGGMKYFLNHKVLKILALDMIVISIIPYFLFLFYQKMLGNSGLGIEYFGFVFSGLIISEILVMNNFRRLENILGSKKRILLFSSLMAGTMLILEGLTTFLPIVLLSIFLGSGFGSSRSVLFSSYYNKYIPSKKRATVLSSISLIRRLSIAVVSPIVGMLADWSFSNTLIILGIIAVIFAFISGIEEDMLMD